jgi:hypothetical protein
MDSIFFCKVEYVAAVRIFYFHPVDRHRQSEFAVVCAALFPFKCIGSSLRHKAAEDIRDSEHVSWVP